ncbi:MAG: serine/threonine-protein kinase [Phycisphaerales bacterium JB043]
MSTIAEREVEFAARLRASRGRDDLWSYLGGTMPDDDDLLAALIAVEGRCLHELGLQSDLGKYLKTISGIVDRPVVLDAAIEAAFRTAPDGSRPVSDETVEALTRRYPQVKDAILEAASLDRLMMSTDTIRRDAQTPVIEEELPCGFGEALPTGKPRYILLERIGAGAHGEVYKAVDRKLSDGENRALVALKVMRPAQDTWQRRRFADEATKARRINHANVVRVIDRGEVDLRDYIVFEFIEGGTLEEHALRKSRRLPVRNAVELVAGIARGVQAAHAAGLVHCDIKPANILVSPKGSPKITDFGIASKLGTNADHAPTIGEATLAGNLAFMAPERFRMRREGVAIASIPADVYAIGGILYWLLTGQLPGGASVAELTARFGGDGPAPSAPSPDEYVRDLDPDLCAICQRALSPNANDRHPAAGSLAEDLEAWLRHDPIPWTHPSPSRRLHLLFRRRPTATLLGSAGALAIVVLIAGLFLQQRIALQNQQQDAIEQARNDAVELYKQGRDERIEQSLDALLVSLDVMGASPGGISTQQQELWAQTLERGHEAPETSQLPVRHQRMILEALERLYSAAFLDDDDALLRTRELLDALDGVAPTR